MEQPPLVVRVRSIVSSVLSAWPHLVPIPAYSHRVHTYHTLASHLVPVPRPAAVRPPFHRPKTTLHRVDLAVAIL